MIASDKNIDESYLIYFEKAQKVYLDLYRKVILKFAEEDIHDLRVSIRRLLSIVDFYMDSYDSTYADKTRKHIKSQFKKLSELRDIQVLIDKAKKYRKAYPNIKLFIEHLAKKEKKLARKVKATLDEQQLADSEGLFFFLGKEMFLNNALLKTSNLIELIDKRFAEVELRVDEIDNEDSETIHETRIAFKKFRYMYELLQPRFPKELRPTKELGQYQTKMGDIQDIEVFIDELGSFIEKSSAFQDMKKLLYKLASQRLDLIDEFCNSKDKYREFWDYELICSAAYNRAEVIEQSIP